MDIKIIEARQYFNGNIIPDIVHYDLLSSPYVIDKHNKALYLFDGDWIITEPSGGYRKCSDKHFKRKYEPVFKNIRLEDAIEESKIISMSG